MPGMYKKVFVLILSTVQRLDEYILPYSLLNFHLCAMEQTML